MHITKRKKIPEFQVYEIIHAFETKMKITAHFNGV